VLNSHAKGTDEQMEGGNRPGIMEHSVVMQDRKRKFEGSVVMTLKKETTQNNGGG